jgi:hypothetical protein
MFKDINRQFGLANHCNLVFIPNAFVVYEIKYFNHSETCKPVIFK